MKVLILGAAGQVGRAVAAACPAEHQVVALGRAEVNISDATAVDAALRADRYDWVVNAAAYTAVDAAEDDAESATAINARAPGFIAWSAAAAGTCVLHLSTDFVFDGNDSRAYAPDSATHPLSVYGATKLAGEAAVLGSAGGIVLRTSWVYASSGRNFVLTMLKLMNERDSVRVVRDQIGSPTWAGSLASAIWALICRSAPAGIYHFSDAGVASWYDFAVAIQEEALLCGLLRQKIPVIPIRSDQYPTRAARPAFSVLDVDATRTFTQLPPVHWRESLRMMLRELRGRS